MKFSGGKFLTFIPHGEKMMGLCLMLGYKSYCRGNTRFLNRLLPLIGDRTEGSSYSKTALFSLFCVVQTTYTILLFKKMKCNGNLVFYGLHQVPLIKEQH